jgi:hypothetical protein
MIDTKECWNPNAFQLACICACIHTYIRTNTYEYNPADYPRPTFRISMPSINKFSKNCFRPPIPPTLHEDRQDTPIFMSVSRHARVPKEYQQKASSSFVQKHVEKPQSAGPHVAKHSSLFKSHTFEKPGREGALRPPTHAHMHKLSFEYPSTAFFFWRILFFS